MCGIIAIKGNYIKEVNPMLSSLSSRGPDEKDFVKIEDVILGQTRLSIIDIEGGHQPMRDNKHPYTIVFNGEIYGYKDLRKKLKTIGHTFRTNSDTEVVLKSYIEYGNNCVNYLDGMFAFAIWNKKTEELFVARDRFGKKPLYYTQIEDTFVVASEIKAIFATNLIKGRIDPSAIDDYLRLMYIPPYKTIYSNIHTLSPAHAGVLKEGKFNTWKYWELKKKISQISYENAKKEIKRLLDEAVKKRMIADVEIGSFLSGGIDSTLITQYAQKYSSKPIKTFSVGYGKYKNELPYAQQASEKIGTDHYSLNVSTNDINELSRVIEYFDEPHGDPSNFPQQLISRMASSKVKVVLSGDGADELLMGYGWYQKYWHIPIYKRIFSNPFSTYQKITQIFSKKEREQLLKSKTAPNNQFEENITKKYINPFDKINIFDLSVYLPGQLLTKVDRTSMMHSLEVRSPFLDTTLAEFIYNLPLKYKLSKNNNKIILKEILEETMPKDFVQRRKEGFGAPIYDWLKEKTFKDKLDKIIENRTHPMYKYLSRKKIKDVLKSPEMHNKISIQKVWTILCLALWFETHKKYHE